jgi:hypothetical protein
MSANISKLGHFQDTATVEGSIVKARVVVGSKGEQLGSKRGEMSDLSIAICASVVSVPGSVAPFLSADDVLGPVACLSLCARDCCN